MQENGGQLREVDPEWVRKGEEVTKEYLNSLSSKLGRQITLDELWDKEKELQKKKEEQEVCYVLHFEVNHVLLYKCFVIFGNQRMNAPVLTTMFVMSVHRKLGSLRKNKGLPKQRLVEEHHSCQE